MSVISRLLRVVGWWLQPLLSPDAEWQRAQLKTIRNELRAKLKTIRNELRAKLKIIHGELGHHEKQIARDLAELRCSVVGLEARVQREMHLNSDALARVMYWQREWRTERAIERLTRLATGGRTILAGPWTGEVGFELIYWIPFIRWFAAEHRVDASRLIVISRGGTDSWYSPLAGRFLDAFDLATPEEFRQHVTGGPKNQRRVRAFDRILLRRARERLGEPVGLLHPALMFHVLKPFSQQRAGREWASRFGQYVRYDPPSLTGLAQPLPERYVAVRFYYSDCFPDNARTRAFIRRTLSDIAAREDVVLIAPSTRVDDHCDALVEGLPRVHVVSDLPAISNLAIQTAIIGRARLFVGTYGGLSYLAPLCGVPAVAFYAVRTFHRHHLLMASEIAERVGGGSLTVIDVADVDRLREVLPMAEPSGVQ